jgi:hypothetical protein
VVVLELRVMMREPLRVVSCWGSYHSWSAVALYHMSMASQKGSSPEVKRELKKNCGKGRREGHTRVERVALDFELV